MIVYAYHLGVKCHRCGEETWCVCKMHQLPQQQRNCRLRRVLKNHPIRPQCPPCPPCMWNSARSCRRNWMEWWKQNSLKSFLCSSPNSTYTIQEKHIANGMWNNVGYRWDQTWMKKLLLFSKQEFVEYFSYVKKSLLHLVLVKSVLFRGMQKLRVTKLFIWDGFNGVWWIFKSRRFRLVNYGMMFHSF